MGNTKENGGNQISKKQTNKNHLPCQRLGISTVSILVDHFKSFFLCIYASASVCPCVYCFIFVLQKWDCTVFYPAFLTQWKIWHRHLSTTLNALLQRHFNDLLWKWLHHGLTELVTGFQIFVGFLMLSLLIYTDLTWALLSRSLCMFLIFFLIYYFF